MDCKSFSLQSSFSLEKPSKNPLTTTSTNALRDRKMSQIRCQNPNNIPFNRIPHYSEQVSKLEVLDMPKILGKVGSIFRKHGVENDFGLVVIHRHFCLQPGEILVDVENEDGTLSIAHPWKMGKNDDYLDGPTEMEFLLSQGFPTDAASFGKIVPTTWAFESGPDAEPGTITPFEFHAIRGDAAEKPGICPPPAFALELFQTLEKLGLLGIFGIRQDSPIFWETTEDEFRANISHFGTPVPPELQDAMKQIFWYFNKKFEDDGGIGPWCAHCCAHGGGTSCGCK